MTAIIGSRLRGCHGQEYSERRKRGIIQSYHREFFLMRARQCPDAGDHPNSSGSKLLIFTFVFVVDQRRIQGRD